MNILLVRPRPDRETIGLQHLMICEPLELEYLAAVASARGHTPIIVDMILERKRLGYFLKKHRPHIVAVTGYITHVHLVKACCRTAKRILPDCVTIAGGVHAEVVPGDFLDESIDGIVRDDALETFRRVIQAVEEGHDPARVPGIWRPGHAEPPAYRPPPDTLFPARQFTARYRARYYYLFHRPCALLKTSYGCPHACGFCYCRAITRGAYSERPLDGVMAELASIDEEDVYIVDDNFLVSRERVLAFCAQLDARGIHKRFLVYGRADFIAAHPDVIETFARTGLRAVIVGLESCDQAELDRYQKNSTVSENEAAVRVLSRHGVDCYATIIIPATWKRRDFRNLGRWLRTLDLAYVNLQPLTPLPGTEDASAEPPGELRIARDDFAKWDLAHVVVKPVHMSASRYYANILWLYHTVSLRPAQARKHLARYGCGRNLRMLVAVMRISLQYVHKGLRALWERA
jgi:hopanoid C-3 methylase